MIYKMDFMQISFPLCYHSCNFAFTNHRNCCRILIDESVSFHPHDTFCVSYIWVPMAPLKCSLYLLMYLYVVVGMSSKRMMYVFRMDLIWICVYINLMSNIDQKWRMMENKTMMEILIRNAQFNWGCSVCVFVWRMTNILWDLHN
jgi:hypothetical protein